MLSLAGLTPGKAQAIPANTATSGKSFMFDDRRIDGSLVEF